MIKLSDYIFKYLADYGVRHVFMLTGGGAMHLNDSVGREERIQYVCNHHEQASAMAAEGYARTSGKIGVVVVTSGPGGTNALTGVIGQWLDSVPVLYLSGQVRITTSIESCRQLDLRQLGDQEINIIDIVQSVTKYAVMVKDPETIRYHLEKALYVMTHGRPGPVWLDLPLDIQAAYVDEDALSQYDSQHDTDVFNQQQVRIQIREVINKLTASERPVLVVGQGVRLAGAVKKFERFIDELHIPVLTAISGHDLIGSDHPLFFGRPGICGDRLGNFVVQNCDFLLVLGARMGLRQISYDYKNFARSAFKVMVDIDQAELKKPTLKIDLPIHSDAGFFIDEMLNKIINVKLTKKKKWVDWCNERKRTLPDIVVENTRNPKYVNSYVFANTLFNQLNAGAIVVTGNGAAYTGTFQVMKIKKGMRVFANQGCAAMGYDLPAAIGACIANNRNPVILITGDGSIQMNIQELQTIISYKLPIKIFILNNDGYLSIKTTQNTYFSGNYVGSNPQSGVTFPDITKIARAYGIPSISIQKENSLDKRIQLVLQGSGPFICEIMMDPNQTLYPKLSSDVRPDGTLVSKPLEDMFPFLSREDFIKHMIIQNRD
jgi:acetolactate synthase I/II/III large subunit